MASQVVQTGNEACDNQELSGLCFAAVIENRAKEVGLAVFDKLLTRVDLVQYVEVSRTYTSTIGLLMAYQPSQTVVVATNQEVYHGGLNTAIRNFPQVALARGFFDDTKGALMLEQHATVDSDLKQRVEGQLRSSCYLALGAAGALLKYLSEEEHMLLAAGSLAVRILSLEDHMHIDSSSVQALELIKPLPGGLPRNAREASLFLWLNRTRTLPGARLLKANILQPLTDVSTLTLRQEALEELLARDVLAYNAGQSLIRLPRDLDKLCASLALRPKTNTSDPARRISALVQAVILLREALSVLPSLAEGLQEASSQLLKAMRANCGHPAFVELLQAVGAVLDEDAHPHKQAFINRTQQCFCVRNGVNGFLDLARAAFCRVTEEIHALVATYKESTGADIKVKYGVRAGFYLSLARPGIETRGGTAGPLPPGFMQLQNKARKEAHCTTHELDALNSRLQDATHDCMVLTHQILDGLVNTVLQRMGLLHKMTDNLALLDMLCAFADVIRDAGSGYVRPKCTEEGPLAIVEGRHPLLERMDGIEFRPNDTYLAECSSFYVISGPNMSGKSTYLRQVALIVILAQMGCFVPAKFASIRMVDRLFTRIGTGDSIESNSSSFMMEMQETACIVDNATPHSLVIIDELGRATSTTDGVGIAWAVSEHLISLGCPTLFATHFARLEELAHLYPNCKLWHFNVDIASDRLRFTWCLRPGSKSAAHYGLKLAPMVGIPHDVASEAERIARTLDREEKAASRVGPTAIQRRLEFTYSLAHKVICVAQSWKQNPQGLDAKQHLQGLQKEAQALFET